MEKPGLFFFLTSFQISPSELTSHHKTAPTGLYGSHEGWWEHHFIPFSSYPDASIGLDQGKSGFRPYSVFFTIAPESNVYASQAN